MTVSVRLRPCLARIIFPILVLTFSSATHGEGTTFNTPTGTVAATTSTALTITTRARELAAQGKWAEALKESH
jgi:hypothetical protein